MCCDAAIKSCQVYAKLKNYFIIVKNRYNISGNEKYWCFILFWQCKMLLCKQRHISKDFGFSKQWVLAKCHKYCINVVLRGCTSQYHIYFFNLYTACYFKWSCSITHLRLDNVSMGRNIENLMRPYVQRTQDTLHTAGTGYRTYYTQTQDCVNALF